MRVYNINFVDLYEEKKKFVKQEKKIEVITPNLFYVVSPSQIDDGNWEQITKGLKEYSMAVEYMNNSFCKRRYPNAFIVASLNGL